VFFGDKKKKGAGGVLLITKAPPKPPEDEEQTDEYDEMLKVTADEILMSVENKDSEGLKIGLKSFFEICSSYGMEEEEM
jgi:hypothetical protein